MGEVIPKMFAVGLPNTLVLAIISGIIGTALGMLLALMGISRNAAVRWIARVYTDILRGLPPVLTILVIGFGFGPIIRELTGSTSPYPMAVAALSLMSGAYIGEIFRSGIQSVDKGQLEASRALGFGYGSSMRLVVVPQGIRRVLPALVNQFIALIKESSLVFMLGLLATEREIFQIGKDAACQHAATFRPYVAAAVFYLVLTIPLTHFVNWIDARLRTGRPEKKEPDEAAAVVGKGAQA